MRNYAQHNRVGIFRKLRHEGFLVKHYAGGYPYQNGKLIIKSSVINPIYSYGNNYKKYGTEFALFIWSTESDIAKISKLFDDVVKGLTKADIKHFNDTKDRYVYLDTYYEGDN